MRLISSVFAVLLGFPAADSNGQTTVTKGVEMNVVYTADLAANVVGGLGRGVRYLDNLDVTVTLTGDPLGWHGGGVFLYGIANQGGSITSLVGDAQVVNNIEAPTNWHLYEALVEQALTNRFSVLAGLYDLNSEFDVNHTGSVFLNSSHGIGPDLSQSGLNGPSIFPVTSLGVRMRAAVSRSVEVRGAILDGVPGDPSQTRGTHIVFGEDDGLLLISEIEVAVRPDEMHQRANRAPRRIIEPPSSRARFVVGGWRYTHRMSRLRNPSETGPSQGAYMIAEWSPYRESTNHKQGVSTFLRAGIADAAVNRFAGYVGLGAVYTGLFRGRDRDRLGFAVAAAINGNPYIDIERFSTADSRISRTETSLEAAYSAPVVSWLEMQMDLQYVINPNTRHDIPNAFVPTVRFVISP